MLRLTHYYLMMTHVFPTLLSTRYTWSLAIDHALSIAQLCVANFGLVPAVAFREPYFLAESPHDFWGNRLDLAFQQLLKRSFYYPIRRLFAARGGESGGGAGTGTGTGGFAMKGAIAATMITFTASGIMHELLWLAMMQSIGDKDRARLGVDPLLCRADGASTLYFIIQGTICVLSTVVVGLIPRHVWRRIPAPIKLYTTLALGPFVGLHYYLDKLPACGYWNGLLELYPVFELNTETLDRWIPPTICFGVLHRDFLLHGLVLIMMLNCRYRTAVAG
jgi:hypothetical protein